METSYLQDPSQCGNVLKGYDGFLSSSKNTALYGEAKIFFSFVVFSSFIGHNSIESSVFFFFLTLVYRCAMLFALVTLTDYLVITFSLKICCIGNHFIHP